MALPDTRCNPYETLLAAGELRAEAAKLANRADLLDNAARIQLDLDEVARSSQTLTPGTVLCVAFGGPAAGTVTRLPGARVQQGELKLLDRTQFDGSKGAGIASVQTHDYAPSVLIKMGPYMVGALLVEKGRIGAMFEQLRASAIDSEVTLALAQMLVLSVGFNPELIYGVIKQMAEATKTFEGPVEDPMFMQLGSN